MHLLYCDETNLTERAGDFQIYGGLLIPSGQALLLSNAVEELREKHKVKRDYRLKFNPGPEGFNNAQFIALKVDVLKVLAAHHANLIVDIILHDIAKNPDLARRNGINTVCYNFDCAVQRMGGAGLVLIDRFNDEGNLIDAHMREKFTIGLTGMPYSSELRLSNIVGIHFSSIGQSHFSSLIDIALGSLRFSINAHTRAQNEHQAASKALLSLISPLMLRCDGKDDVLEIGFTLSPKVIKVPHFKEKYQGLKDYLSKHGIALAQTISDQRQY